MSHYDVKIRHLFAGAGSEVLRRLFGEEVKASIDSRLLTGEARQVDYLGQTASGGLLHIETRTSEPPAMAWRILNFRVAIGYHYSKWKPPSVPLRQIVIFLKKKRPRTKTKLIADRLWFDYEETTLETAVADLEFGALGSEFQVQLLILIGTGDRTDTKWKNLCNIACQTQSIEIRSDRIIALDVLSQLVDMRDYVRRELNRVPITVNVRGTVYGEEIYDSGFSTGQRAGRRGELERMVSRHIIEKNISARSLEDIKRLDLDRLSKLEAYLHNGLGFWEAVADLDIREAFSI